MNRSFPLFFLFLFTACASSSGGQGAPDAVVGTDTGGALDAVIGSDPGSGNPLVPGMTASQSKPLMSGYWKAKEYQAEPAIAPYALPLAEVDIANRDRIAGYLDTEPLKTRLLANGFVVLPFGQTEDFGQVYESLENLEIPPFVTADTLLHLYHVQFDEILKELEETRFHADVIALTDRLIGRNAELFASSQGLFREAAKRNLAFFWTARSLLVVKDDPATSPAGKIPSEVADVVAKELALVEKHSGFQASPLFLYKEDYSQYVPRGHYTRSEKLKSYFKAMMWYGRMTMLLKGGDPACEYDFCPALISPYDADVQTVQALLTSIDLDTLKAADGRALSEVWGDLYRITAFFVGLADDLTYYEYRDAIAKVLGAAADVAKIGDADTLFALRSELALLRSPEIYGGTGGQAIVIEPGQELTPEMLDKLLDKSKGFRLMGQRFVPDSYAFGRLVAPVSGQLNEGADTTAFTAVFTDAGIWVRGFPRGLDIMALLGSARARDLLKTLGDDAYTKYEESFGNLEAFFAKMGPADWHQNLYWGWLDALKPLLEAHGEGYQTFQQTQAWQDRSLTAALASWAELRHDTILYAKQSYTPPIETTSVPPEPPPGYVEPVPEFFSRLASLNAMTRDGLADLGALPDGAKKRLDSLQVLLDRLLAISATELSGKPVSEADGHFLNHISEALETVLGGIEPTGAKTTLVADVHTDGNTKQVLEEGVGYVELLLVAYKIPDGRIVVGAGPVFSYHEFRHPMADRLTDEAWREMLAGGKAPEPPPWTKTFRVP